MECEIVFLAVGNADSIIICPDNNPCILVDVPKPRAITDWLKKQNKTHIDNIYITHAHKDHFIGLHQFVEFINQWGASNSQIKKVIVGKDVFLEAFKEFHELKKLKKTDSPTYKKLQATWDKINLLKKAGTLFRDETRDNTTPSYIRGNLTIKILHPDLISLIENTVKSVRNLNEESLILRVTYGTTSAILLADLEGKGINECLNVCSNEELEAEIVKIPHHGAWKEPSAEFENLLDKINPEIAILSVGSTNPYGHVVPKLFRKLLDNKQNTFLKLESFICTEATRTCTKSKTERATMANKGLASSISCAGDITIVFEVSGGWRLVTQTNHPKTIASLKFPACENRAEL